MPVLRVEAVKRADELALAASRKPMKDAARLHIEAARIRARTWRTEGREADALEAAELYRAAAHVAWEGACDATVDLALFEGERQVKPSGTYEALYRAKARFPDDAACAKRIDAALTTLDAFKPPRALLASIDGRASPEPPGAAAPESIGIGAGDLVLPEIRQIPAEPASITKMEHYPGKDAARVVVFVTHPTLFDVGVLAATDGRGPRLYVDIRGAKYRGNRAVPGEGLVEGIRVGARPDGTRVVLDLGAMVYRKVFYLPEPFRLVIDVNRERPSEDLGSRAGPRIIQRVVLDPGHGGHDSGATGVEGLREKDVALDVAHRAAPLIARELGISTLLTRDADAFVPLDERVARANAFGADLFVSIHCNANENASTHGVTTFVLDASRDDLAAKVAARENSASPAAAVELANAMSRVLDPGTMGRSAHFAGLLQRSAIASIGPTYPGTQDLGVRRAGFYVLAGAQMPAVLFETAFISHSGEARRLDSADYRQKLADAIVNAVRAFREGI
jgi:N-acetylmuramoyl-L-alanine amidase